MLPKQPFHRYIILNNKATQGFVLVWLVLLNVKNRFSYNSYNSYSPKWVV